MTDQHDKPQTPPRWAVEAALEVMVDYYKVAAIQGGEIDTMGKAKEYGSIIASHAPCCCGEIREVAEPALEAMSTTTLCDGQEYDDLKEVLEAPCPRRSPDACRCGEIEKLISDMQATEHDHWCEHGCESPEGIGPCLCGAQRLQHYGKELESAIRKE